MSDEVDRAQQREEDFREDALQAQQRRAGLTGTGRYAVSARTCGVCGEKIPITRRRAVPGVQTCIDCQQELERGLRWDGRHG